MTDLSDRLLKIKNVLFLTGSIALILFLIESLAVFKGTNLLRPMDDYLIHRIQSGISAPGTNLMISITQLASPAAITLLSVLLVIFLIYKNNAHAAIWFLATLVAGAALINPLLKQLFSRPRPLTHRIINELGYSYPSGHAIAATLFYGSIIVLTLIYSRKRFIRIFTFFICGAVILMVMLSRIYLGVHYPTDVLAGFFTGTSVVCFSAGFFILRRSLHHKIFNQSGYDARMKERTSEAQDESVSS